MTFCERLSARCRTTCSADHVYICLVTPWFAKPGNKPLLRGLYQLSRKRTCSQKDCAKRRQKNVRRPHTVQYQGNARMLAAVSSSEKRHLSLLSQSVRRSCKRRAVNGHLVYATVQTQLDVDHFVQHSQKTRASLLEVLQFFNSCVSLLLQQSEVSLNFCGE